MDINHCHYDGQEAVVAVACRAPDQEVCHLFCFGPLTQLILVVPQSGHDPTSLLHLLHHLLPLADVHRPSVVGEDGGGQAEV